MADDHFVRNVAQLDMFLVTFQRSMVDYANSFHHLTEQIRTFDIHRGSIRALLFQYIGLRERFVALSALSHQQNLRVSLFNLFALCS